MKNAQERGSAHRWKWGAWILLLAGLGMAGSGCGWIVTQSAFDKEKQEVGTKLDNIRRELLAHTQILASHSKAIGEVRLQLRDALSGGKSEERMAGASKAPVMEPAAPKPTRKTSRGKTMYVRRVYQGLPLNYAAGYRSPRGARYPYRLAPGTQVRVLSGDSRGFTHVEVKSGPLRGRKMWVRTRWLVSARQGRRG